MKPASRHFRNVFRGLLACFGFAVAVQADTWTLANGDSLTGELINEYPEFIVVQHPQLGRLKLYRMDLAKALTFAPPPAEGQPPGGEQAKAVANDSASPEAEPKWKRQIEVGYVQQSGAKEKQDLAIRVQLDGMEGNHTLRAIGRVLRSEASGKTVNDRQEGEFRWRYDINSKFFTQVLSTYEEDSVRNIDLNLEQQIGGGLKVFDSARHKANVGLGAVVQYQDLTDLEVQTALLASVFQDYTYQLTTRLKLVQESSFMASDKGSLNLNSTLASATTEGNYRLRFNTGLQSKVTDHMSLNIRFEYDYDRSILEPELRADQRLLTTLGYLW